MSNHKHLRLLGERDARAGKSINAFYDLPLAGHHRYNEGARSEYEIGYRAAKQEMRRELRAKEQPPRNWLDVAPEDEQQCRDYFVRLISILSHRVTLAEMDDAVESALKGRLHP